MPRRPVPTKPYQMPTSPKEEQRVLTIRLPLDEFLSVKDEAHYDHSMNQFARRALMMFPNLIELLHAILMTENVTAGTRELIERAIELATGEDVRIATSSVQTTANNQTVCTENPLQNPVDSNV